ncbi:MATE family efflux transporter [Shinella fusca]|jgi:MATE family multidrug resistance protein|uniref:MATE family multidrug resistance protein n=1 Tax=Shinella fusca TaxID=544480 RepID=A0A7W7YXI5_9HYPH|nr:MATE family efflux transporter [Shinella fusca]MBB5044186.1 MATE family multidrug resistance protein [Shinella fusca]
MSAATIEENEGAGPFEVTHRLVLSIAIPMTLGFLTTPLIGLTDTAVAGRLGSADALAGMAVGAVIFDLLLGSFNFLRASTTGLVAQAFGRGDRREEQAVYWRSLAIALCSGLALALLSPFLLAAGLFLMAPSPGVAEVTTVYFSIRVLSAPLSLANYALLGFVLGRGQGMTGLFLQAVINGVNIVLSIVLGLGLGWGVAGIAWAAFTGETVGMLTGLLLIVSRFDRRERPSRAEIFARERMRALFSLNRDIMIRTFVLIGAFAIMTRIGSSMGPLVLAANAVLMNIFLVAGYYLDGIANAAEQLVGRAFGANFRPAFDRAVKLTMLWSFGLGVVTTLLFLLFGENIIGFLTTTESVRAEAVKYLPWAALTAITGALAFQMDGVFIGATWSAAMRNMMLAAFVGYIAAIGLFVPLLGNHGLWLALNLFLAFRGIFLALRLPALAGRQFAVAGRS